MAKAPPNKVRFEDRWLTALSKKPVAKGKRPRYWDALTPSLTVRVTDKGTISFVVVAPMRGKQAYHVLGHYPQLSLSQARKEVPAILTMFREGRSPKLERARAQADTLEVVVEKYLAFIKGKRSSYDTEGMIRRHFLGQNRTRTKAENGEWVRGWENGRKEYYRNTPVLQLTREMIMERLDAIRASDGKFPARRTLSAIRACLNWAEDGARFGVTQSPAARIRDRHIGISGSDLRRQRVLTDAELRQVWAATEEFGLFGSLVRLLMLTGQRRNDIAMARWDEIDLDEKVLTIPPARFKTGVAHEVPLTPAVIKILQGMPTWGTAGYVFTFNGRRPMTGISYQKKKLDDLIKKRRGSPLPRYVLHDLRRTARTRLSDLGVDTSIAELVIGHAQPGLHQVYNMSSHRPQKRAALELWSNKLMSIVAPAPDAPNVVRLRA